MKRDRNTILKPCVGEEFQWDFQVVKRLSGQGKLYVSLSIVNDQSDDSSDLESALFNDDDNGDDVDSRRGSTSIIGSKQPKLIATNKECSSSSTGQAYTSTSSEQACSSRGPSERTC